MNKKIYTEYCIKNAIKDKKKTKMAIILILISMLIIFLFSFKSTITNFFLNGVTKDIGYRTLFVARDDSLYTEKEMIEQLKKIDHVVEVFPDNQYYTVLNVSSKNYSGTIGLTGSSVETRPVISYGRNIKNDYEIICPEKFYPDENIIENKDLKIKDFINMKENLQNNVIAEYKKIIDESQSTFINKKINLKVVGTYKNSSAFVDESTCYGTYNLVGKISNDMYENIDMSSQTNSIMVQIDSSENINFVINEINKKGHLVYQSLSFDETLLNIVTKSMYIILFISLFFIISVITYINNKDYENSIAKINILRSIGFKNKDIFKINYFEKNFIGLIIFIALSVILLIIFIIYKILLYYKPFIFSKIPITLSFSSIFITFLLIFISLNVCTFIFNKKVKKSSIIEGLKQ